MYPTNLNERLQRIEEVLCQLGGPKIGFCRNQERYPSRPGTPGQNIQERYPSRPGNPGQNIFQQERYPSRPSTPGQNIQERYPSRPGTPGQNIQEIYPSRPGTPGQKIQEIYPSRPGTPGQKIQEGYPSRPGTPGQNICRKPRKIRQDLYPDDEPGWDDRYGSPGKTQAKNYANNVEFITEWDHVCKPAGLNAPAPGQTRAAPGSHWRDTQGYVSEDDIYQYDYGGELAHKHAGTTRGAPGTTKIPSPCYPGHQVAPGKTKLFNMARTKVHNISNNANNRINIG